MKFFLKYLIVLIVTAACFEGSGRSDIMQEIDSSAGAQVESSVYYTCLSAADSDLCLPRQTSSTGTVSIQGIARKITNIPKYNFECIKAGKIINSGIRYYIQNNSTIFSSLTEPAHILTCLGKLII